ncbi:MAG: SDR family oxidoreductase [Rhodospirillaceae bacterium]|nr:SDR family oxidoreductase [Rhodospirillaceae bacterium]
MKLQGKRAIVTGAARGIGRAISARFIAEGAKVLMADIDAKAVQAASAELGAESFAGDVAVKRDTDALVAKAIQVFGGVDILVNNAGITHAADFFDLTETDFDRVIAVNLKAAFLLGQAAGKDMSARRSGVIINMSSINAIVAIPNQIPYAASKGGVNQLTKVMALALAPHGIRVNAIGPGTIFTEMAQSVLSDPEIGKRALSRTPIGRYGQPEEIASVAVFLASDESSYMIGQTIYPEGGRLALNYTVPVV